MALSIKNENTEHLARSVADETGETLTQAIQTSLQQRWDRLKNNRKNQTLATQLDDILRRVDEMPDLDNRTPDDVIGYDEYGLPR